MNPFNLSLKKLDLPAPQQVRVPLKFFQSCDDANYFMHCARQKAACKLLAIRKHRLKIRNHAKQYVQTMLKRAQAQSMQLREQVSVQVIKETIEWIIQTQQIEQEIAKQLRQQACNWAIIAVKNIVRNLNQTDTLIQYLQDTLEKLPQKQQLILHVHPIHYKKVQHNFSSINELTVIADAQLQSLQALLESPWVLIKLDIDHGINQVFQLLLHHQKANLSVTEQQTSKSNDGSGVI